MSARWISINDHLGAVGVDCTYYLALIQSSTPDAQLESHTRAPVASGRMLDRNVFDVLSNVCIAGAGILDVIPYDMVDPLPT